MTGYAMLIHTEKRAGTGVRHRVVFALDLRRRFADITRGQSGIEKVDRVVASGGTATVAHVWGGATAASTRAIFVNVWGVDTNHCKICKGKRKRTRFAQQGEAAP